MISHEKRSHTRVRAELPCTCVPAAASTAGAEPFIGNVADISIGGAFVLSDKVPHIGERITIVLEARDVLTFAPRGGSFPPVSAVTRLDAFVRWHRPDGFGVQFGLLGARETHLLSALVKNHP